MENIAEALKLAGFTLLFVIALSIAMITIMQGKRTSETIISYSDKTKYYSNIEENSNKVENGNRIVKIKDIIPTLYRYDQEQYIVLFKDFNGKALKILKDTENNKTKAKKIYGADISYLNYNLEAKLEEDWTRDHSTIKKHVDEVVKCLFEEFEDEEFIEQIYETNNIYENNKKNDNYEINIEQKNDEKKIRVIMYTLKE